MALITYHNLVYTTCCHFNRDEFARRIHWTPVNAVRVNANGCVTSLPYGPVRELFMGKLLHMWLFYSGCLHEGDVAGSGYTAGI